MKWFEKKKPAAKPPQVQLRDWEHHPFGLLDQYVPLRSGEIALYRSIREAVPILDAAIWKLVRLCGGVQIRCRDSRAQQGLSRFLATVDTGRGQQGIQSFLCCTKTLSGSTLPYLCILLSGRLPDTLMHSMTH